MKPRFPTLSIASNPHYTPNYPADSVTDPPHILENVRDVVLEGRRDVTCLSCHDIHRQSSRKHRYVGADGHCATCHAHDRNGVVPQPLDVHGKVCGY